MAYHDDLLAQAFHLVRLDPANPKEANLRRGVSSAYYAVFHLLTSEMTSNYAQRDLRAVLARAFNHGLMKNTSKEINKPSKYPFTGEDPVKVRILRNLGVLFMNLQDHRHFADYDLSRPLDPVDALSQVTKAQTFVNEWQTVRAETCAQTYLVKMLVNRD
jgi:hypothetical protein